MKATTGERMKTITNQQAWAELTSAQNQIMDAGENLQQFFCQLTGDNSAEGAMLGDQITEIRQQLEDVKRKLRTLSCYYMD
ncbi:hypothetical protein ACFQUX_03365 [Pantoea stewartii]